MELDLRVWATREPQRLAVRIAGTDTSYGELEALSNRMAHLMRGRGIRRGDHVAAVVGNDVSIFALVWAAYRVGAYLTPIPSTASAPDIAYVVEDCGARLVVANAQLRDTLAELPALVGTGPAWFSVNGEMAGFESLDDLLPREPASPVEDESCGALMMYTSGTTGRPKGVIRPLPAQRPPTPTFASDLIALFGLSSESRYLSTAPLYHAAPLRWGLAFLTAGGSMVVMPKFDAAQALDLIERERITHSQWVPTMFHRLLALPQERRQAFHAPWHRMAVHAAAPCAVPLKRAMIEWWGPIIEEYYAGSESVGLTAITSQEWLRKPGSVGRSKKGPIHVIDEDDNELAPGTPGRVFFSGVSPFAYHNEPAKTASRTSRQGWQTFGDVGYVDEDGYLFLTDRLDDMIISGGVNIYPQELEAAINELDDVAEAAVVGTSDPEYGERPVAFVVPKDPSADPDAFSATVDAWCRQRLGSIKRPKQIRVMQALPYSPQGKLLRRELRRLVAAAA